MESESLVTGISFRVVQRVVDVGDLELEVGVRRGDVLLAPRDGFLRDIEAGVASSLFR